MNAQTSENKNKALKGNITTGIVLIAIGLTWLLFDLIDRPALFPIFLGAGFLLSGCLTRSAGLIIPGGIIGGVGLAIVAIENNPFGAVSEPASGGIFMAAFALGWFSITLLTGLFTKQTEWWPLIPGSIMALIGGLILAGESGLQVLMLIGQYWPLALVIAGIAVLVKYFRQNG